MCTLCEWIETGLTAEDAVVALQKIGVAVNGGLLAAEHFREALDTLMDTGMEERDVDVESAWDSVYGNPDR